MRYLAAFVLLAAIGCASKALPPVRVVVPDRPIGYLQEVKPILEKRCTVCHSCYNSPCQLKLDSFDGVDRGATKRTVYNAARLKSMDPTRLFVDARTTKEWRAKKFVSVTENSAGEGYNDSIMLQMLDHKIRNPRSTGEYRPETDDLTCAGDRDELGEYLGKHPNRGMPYGFPPLKQDEFAIIAGWLAQGAKGPDADQQKALETPKPADAASVARWESFLNAGDPKHAMTARYLYEHLFLAHISFGTGTNEFYEIVRSRTAPGTPIDIVATVRPYDDPGSAHVYYRFRKIHSTIVNKTHMVFELDDARFARVNELFIAPDWLTPPHLVGYDPRTSANPFVAFEQIPPRSRYQFLLDNAQYILMTFIHGPVCKGQIALNVIDDHFWVLFMDPDHDLTVRHPGFLRFHSERLRMPTEDGSDKKAISILLDDHRKRAVEFYRARQDLYATHLYDGLPTEAIWKGGRAADAPVLTVYRHFDSASVHRGVLGELPKTLWVIDYPLMERIYYALVAGFDVYGTAGHQLAIRLYMDALRVEGESNFLDFLPPRERRVMMQGWYGDVNVDRVNYYPSTLPAGRSFVTSDHKREFVESVVLTHLRKDAGITFDRVNYESSALAQQEPRGIDGFLRMFRAQSRPGTPFVSAIDDYNANLAYVRIRCKDGTDAVFTMVANRWHDNVAFPIGEEGRLDPSKDSIDFIPGMIGSYPNYFFDIAEEDLPDFVRLLSTFDKSAANVKRMARYGINRADERFWDVYDWFQKRFDADDPVRGGLLDLNRYFYLAD